LGKKEVGSCGGAAPPGPRLAIPEAASTVFLLALQEELCIESGRLGPSLGFVQEQ